MDDPLSTEQLYWIKHSTPGLDRFPASLACTPNYPRVYCAFGKVWCNDEFVRPCCKSSSLSWTDPSLSAIVQTGPIWKRPPFFLSEENLAVKMSGHQLLAPSNTLSSRSLQMLILKEENNAMFLIFLIYNLAIVSTMIKRLILRI